MTRGGTYQTQALLQYLGVVQDSPVSVRVAFVVKTCRKIFYLMFDIKERDEGSECDKETLPRAEKVHW